MLKAIHSHGVFYGTSTITRHLAVHLLISELWFNAEVGLGNQSQQSKPSSNVYERDSVGLSVIIVSDEDDNGSDVQGQQLSLGFNPRIRSKSVRMMGS